VQVPGVKVGTVWSAFLCARHDLMLEAQRLRASRQEHVQDAVAVLSSMLQKFSEDVLWLQHMRSAAAAAVAPSEPDCLTRSTEATQVQQLHSELEAGCSAALMGRNRAFMSSLHAHGIMHAVQHMSARKFKVGETSESCPHLPLPDIVAGGAGQGQSSQSQDESGCDVECTDAIAKCTGIRDPPVPTLPETLPPAEVQHGPTWHEVCTKSNQHVPPS
jgi:hypothetical protein